MNIRYPLIAAACTVALAACSDRSPPPAATSPEPAAVEPAPSEPMPPAEAPAPVAAPAASGKPAAVVSDCATEIEGDDAMQYNVGSIVVPASCSEFKITLKHTGKMPVAAMGHNVVIAKAADMQAVASDGVAAGADAAYVKADDARVVAHSPLVGGGESTSVSFAVDRIKEGGPYEFFCTFPGHAAIMKGTISVQ